MRINKLLSYVLALVLFAAPAMAQVIPRSGAGGAAAAGGATEATLLTRATEATQLLILDAFPLEDTVHADADRGAFILGVRNSDAFPIAFTSATGDYSPIATGTTGAVLIVNTHEAGYSGLIIVSKREGSVHADTDAGIPNWGVVNLLNTSLASGGEYAPRAVTGRGYTITTPSFSSDLTSARQVPKLEDTGHTTGDVGNFILAVRNDNAATNLTNLNLDYAPFVVDNRGVQFVQGRQREDDGAANADFGFIPLSLRDDILAAGVTTADNDFTYRRVDTHGAGWMALTADDGLRVPADSVTGLKVRPMDAVLIEELVELIGINENVANTQYGESVSVALAATHSGEILKTCLTTTEDGAGSILTPAGTLFILDATTANAVGATTITAVERLTILARITYAATDWQSDANGGTNCKVIADGFHANGTLHALWFHEDATAFNDVAGDDEQLELAFWYRRDS